MVGLGPAPSFALPFVVSASSAFLHPIPMVPCLRLEKYGPLRSMCHMLMLGVTIDMNPCLYYQLK